MSNCCSKGLRVAQNRSKCFCRNSVRSIVYLLALTLTKAFLTSLSGRKPFVVIPNSSNTICVAIFWLKIQYVLVFY